MTRVRERTQKRRNKQTKIRRRRQRGRVFVEHIGLVKSCQPTILFVGTDNTREGTKNVHKLNAALPKVLIATPPRP